MNSNKIETCMVLAAGLGSRLYPITNVIPKPGVPFFNKPIILRIIEQAISLGVKRVIVNLFYHERQLRAILEQSNISKRIELILIKENNLLGTGGGIYNARNYFKGDNILIINSDIVFDFKLDKAIQFHFSSQRDATLILVNRQDSNEKRKVIVNKQTGKIISFRGKNLSSQNKPTIFSGIHIINKQFIQNLNLSSKQVSCIVRNGYEKKPNKIFGFFTTGFWSDIGTPIEYLQAHINFYQKNNGFFLIKQGYRQPTPEIFIGSKVRYGNGTEFRPPVIIGNNAKIGRNCEIGPFAIIGDNCIVESGTIIESSVIFSNLKVHGNRFQEIVFANT